MSLQQSHSRVPRKGLAAIRMFTTRKFMATLMLIVIYVVLYFKSRRSTNWSALKRVNDDASHQGDDVFRDRLQPAVLPSTPPLMKPLSDVDAGNSLEKNAATIQSQHPSLRLFPDPMCKGYPDGKNVLLVMKTGASESFRLLPTHTVTMLRCIHDFLIFSDMDQNIGVYHLHDSLDKVLDSAMNDNRDFDLYRRQKTCILDQGACNAPPGTTSDETASAAWSLDKYKNIHIAEKTYQMRPDYDWYLFIDADTYVLWPNMIEWLAKFDPTKQLYIGSVAYVANFPFCHGGSGYIISQAAMRGFVGENPGIANKYDHEVPRVCCGDYLLSVAINDSIGIMPQNMWPTVNGEGPTTIPFGPSHWCNPVVTMHHVSVEYINAMWNYERSLYNNGTKISGRNAPLLFRDIYYHFVAPNLIASRDDWDNMSLDRFYYDLQSGRSWTEEDIQQDEKTRNPKNITPLEKEAHRSFDHCGAACKSLGHESCFQWKYREGECVMGRSFKLGFPAKKEDDYNKLRSGWDVEKIQKWIADQGDTCDDLWPTSNF